ncbi:MAG: type II toxin-antitoxin system RelE/ParE family toxin [Pseudomonadota bacterium]|nr:type II toxin-antitoxin system RelE/ParE family toxin [Pseudomonadota bacterium]
MNYSLRFKHEALKEWRKLDYSIKSQFKKKLKERLQNPSIPADKLSGRKNRYKIKLRTAGYRLVYEVRKSALIIVVIAVGKREKNSIYKMSETR